MKVSTLSGKRKREPEGQGILPDAKKLYKDAAAVDLIAVPRVYSRETCIADLPNELLYRIAGNLVPSSPYLSCAHDNVARIFPYAQTLLNLDHLSRVSKWAQALVQGIRIYPAFHDFRQLASQVEYEYRNSSSNARVSSIRRYAIDPVIAPQTHCPQRAACHLDFPPAALEELAVHTIEACWRPGLGHAVIAREVHSSAQLAGLVKVLQYGRLDVEELDITISAADVDMCPLLGALKECAGIQHLALSTPGTFPSEHLGALMHLTRLTAVKLKASVFDAALFKRMAELPQARNLECLSLRCETLTENAYFALAQTAAAYRKLCDLQLYGGQVCNQSTAHLATAIQAMPMLECLTMAGIRHGGAQKIVQAKHLRSLSFPEAHLNTTGCLQLLTLLQRQPGLQQLMLSSPLDDAAVASLGALLIAPNCQLRELVLQGCGLEMKREFADALESNRSLDTFILRDNPLDFNGVANLAFAIQRNSKLLLTHIVNCDIEPNLAAKLSFAIGNNSSLLEFKVEGIRLAVDDAKYFFWNLSENTGLLAMSIPGENLSSELLTQIDQLLKSNRRR